MQRAYGHYGGLRAFGSTTGEDAILRLKQDTAAALTAAASIARAKSDDLSSQAAAHALRSSAKNVRQQTPSIFERNERFFVGASIAGGLLIIALVASALSTPRSAARVA